MNSTLYQQTTSDGAIENSEQDKFDRKDFALHLAAGIVARRKQNSFVLSLQGAWGCGKTSIKNLALAELRKRGDAPEIVEFEPWQLRDADALFATFFKEIALAITGEGEGAAQSKERLEAYSKSLELGGSVIKSIGTLASVLEVPGGKLLEVIGEKMGDASGIAKQGADASLNKSLRDQKRELGELLRKLDRPILVIIDDIDRLEVAEMLLIFQLIKANADFPNFTYLLLMHRERVQDALTDRLGTYGSDYLEKIVQLPIDVPPANSAQRYALLKGRINKLLEGWGVSFSDAEQTDLALLWQGGLDELLLQPRDVVRALNAVEFSLAIMKSEKELEVNLADFVALEALRITEATTYARLAGVKYYLTQSRPRKRSELQSIVGATHGLVDPKLKDDEQPGETEMKDALGELSRKRSHAAHKVLTFIFPSAFWALDSQDQAERNAVERRPELSWRVKEDRYFDRYFSLAIPNDQISQAEISRFVRALPDEAALMLQLEALCQRDLHKTFLHELFEHFSKVPAEHRVYFLKVHLDFWESQEYYHPLEALFNLIFLPMTLEERGELISDIFGKSQAYAIPSLWLLRQNKLRDDLKKTRLSTALDIGPDERHWMTAKQWEPMRDLILSRVKQHVTAPDFWKGGRIMQNCIVLWFSVEPQKVKEWVAQQSATDEQLPLFLLHFSDYDLYNPNAEETLALTRFEWQIFDWIEDLPALRARVESLDFSDLGNLMQTLQRKFLGFSKGWLDQVAKEQNDPAGEQADSIED